LPPIDFLNWIAVKYIDALGRFDIAKHDEFVPKNIGYFEGMSLLTMSDVSLNPNSYLRRVVDLTFFTQDGYVVTLSLQWDPTSNTYYFEKAGNYSQWSREDMLGFFNQYCTEEDHNGALRKLLALDEGGYESALEGLRALYLDIFSLNGIDGVDRFLFPFLDAANIHEINQPIIDLFKRLTSSQVDSLLRFEDVDAIGVLDPINTSNPNFFPSFESVLEGNLKQGLPRSSIVLEKVCPLPFLSHLEDEEKLEWLYKKGVVSFEDYKIKRAYYESPDFLFESGVIDLDEFIEALAVDRVKIRSIHGYSNERVRIVYDYGNDSGVVDHSSVLKSKELNILLPHLDDFGDLIPTGDLERDVKFERMLDDWKLNHAKRILLRHNPEILRDKPKVALEGNQKSFSQIDFIFYSEPLRSAVRFLDGDDFVELQHDVIKGVYFLVQTGVGRRITRKGVEGYLKKLDRTLSPEAMYKVRAQLILNEASLESLAAAVCKAASVSVEGLKESRRAEDSLVIRMERRRRPVVEGFRKAAAAVVLFFYNG